MYKVTVSIAYEGDFSEYKDTLDEVKSFIRNHDCSLNDITIEEIWKTIDVYELMSEE